MFKRISDPACDMDAPIPKDESVRDYQYYSYDARTPNQRGRIELQVQDTSRYFLLSKAFLEIEDVDVATTILGLARYSDDYSRSAGPSMMFAKDTTDFPENRNVTIGNMRNSAGDNTTPAVLSMNANFNLGFAVRKSMLKGHRGAFSCAIPLSYLWILQTYTKGYFWSKTYNCNRAIKH
ncbi:hypothetical protein CHS0354_016059 [Potamilus streckersoni]|uniref:Uncharacterized protein n=1 Tax=Potamilus streckersoni TaxID=2493646 RepID=A0AAE0T0X8_9BIVA|nr:hypothetical protein CHS0354_016059 [Potamilus streckersoni]